MAASSRWHHLIAGLTGRLPRTAAEWADTTARVRAFPEGQRESFQARGFTGGRRFVPHEVHVLRRPGPDGLRLAGWLCGERDPARLLQLIFFADPCETADLPPDLFHDSEVLWHRQHLGRPGQFAHVSVVVRGRELVGLSYVSDLVQRIGRRPDVRSRVENRFHGWPSMVLNAVVSLADELGLSRVRSPTADAVLAHADPSREVGRDLFERVYDRTVTHHFAARRRGRWWVLDVAANRDRLVAPQVRDVVLRRPRTICVFHDVERGRGHLASDPGFAAEAEVRADADLSAMLDVERTAGVRTTYNVLGALLPAVRQRIEQDGHPLAFHSFDHGRADQLRRCREVDYRIAGYRPPQSRLTRELSDRNLCLFNFEWLAASQYALRSTAPDMRRGVVRIPVTLDDYPLYAERLPYGEWERRALEAVAGAPFAAIGLHDCYARWWLPNYPAFLRALADLGTLQTFDAVTANVALATAR